MPDEKMDIPLSILIQFIPKFRGEASEAFSFIQNCENAFKLAKEPQHKPLLAFAKSCISGNASSILMNKTLDSWSQLKAELNKVYKENYSNLQLHRELIQLKQQYDETVVQYTQKCETLQRRMLQNEVVDTETSDWKGKSEYIKLNILNAFVNGLKEKISSYVNNRKPEDLNEASRYAIEEESRLGLHVNLLKPSSSKDYTNKNTVRINTITCFACGKVGHKANVCRNRHNRQNNYTNIQQKRQNNQSNTHTHWRRPSGQPIAARNLSNQNGLGFRKSE